MQTIIRYLLIVLTDGDYLNDWLTHMPDTIADVMQIIGWLLTL